MTLKALAHTLVNADTLTSEIRTILNVGDIFGEMVQGGGAAVLLTLPAFDGDTGRLIQGDWYNTRTSTNSTFINSDSKVETVLDAELIYSDSRVVQNLAASTALPATQDVTVISGNSYLVSIGAGSAAASTAACSDAFTGTLTGDGVNRISFDDGTAKTATSTTLTVTITGAITDLHVEDVTAKSVQDAPGEYESVGVDGSTGYGIYNRANGNTVDANGVVTDTPGAVLSTAPTMRHAPAATNLAPDSINPSAWTDIGSCTMDIGTGPQTGIGNLNKLTATATSSCKINTITAFSSLNGVIGTVEVFVSAGDAVNSRVRLQQYPSSTALWHNITWTGGVPSAGTTSGSVVANSFYSIALANGVYKVGFSFTGHVTDTSCHIRMYPDITTGTKYCYFGMPSAVVGSVRTPFIPTSGGTASRFIDSILYPYSASVFDPDEGSMYIELTFTVDTDDFTAFADLAYVALDDAYGTDDLVAGNASASGSTMTSDDSGTAVTNAHTNIAAGTTVPIAVLWSKAANTYEIGTKVSGTWDWGTAGAFAGFTATDLIGLLVASGAEAEITDFEVLDSYLTEAEAEARWP